MRATISLAAAAILALPSDALAYIDPGSGSIVLQSILALLAAGFVTVRLVFKRFTGLFSRDTPEITKPDGDDSEKLSATDSSHE